MATAGTGSTLLQEIAGASYRRKGVERIGLARTRTVGMARARKESPCAFAGVLRDLPFRPHSRDKA